MQSFVPLDTILAASNRQHPEVSLVFVNERLSTTLSLYSKSG